MVGALVRSGRQVRAFDIASDVEQLAGAGVADVMVGDLLDPADLHRAVEGVSVVVYIGPPMHPREVEMGHGVVSAARHAGVEHFVQFSVTHPQLELLLNHQAKLEVERCVLLSRMPFTILQPMHYMQNIDVARVVAEGVLRQPYGIGTPLAHVDLEDVAEVAAAVVGNADHHYATYELCGQDFLTATELAQVMSAESGRPVTAEMVPFPVGAADGPRASEADDYRLDAMHRLFDHYGRYGITGNPNVLGWLLGRRPTGFDEYVRRSLAAH